MGIKKENAKVHYNAACLCCNGLEKEMVRIGVLIFCAGCFKTEFCDNDEPEGEIYSEWFAVYETLCDIKLEKYYGKDFRISR